MNAGCFVFVEDTHEPCLENDRHAKARVTRLNGLDSDISLHEVGRPQHGINGVDIAGLLLHLVIGRKHREVHTIYSLAIASRQCFIHYAMSKRVK